MTRFQGAEHRTSNGRTKVSYFRHVVAFSIKYVRKSNFDFEGGQSYRQYGDSRSGGSSSGRDSSGW
jgi:hypothetical protein